MNAFERQVACEVLVEAGPSRPYDVLAIVQSITVRGPKSRFGAMFSGTNVVLAGAVAALFGVFLLAGVVTRQPIDEPPAGGVPSASATAEPNSSADPTTRPTADPEQRVDTALLPGVTLVTEEVEAGVFRVVKDGVRELTTPLPDDESSSYHRVVAGLDGSIWMQEGGEGATFPDDVATSPGYGDLFRLGDPQRYWAYDDVAPPFFPYMGVGPDGSLWGAGADMGLWTLDPTKSDPTPGWEERSDDVRAVAFAPDGTVWVAVWLASESSRTTLLARWDDDRGTFDVEPFEGAPTGLLGLWATDAGDVWLWRGDGYGEHDDDFIRLHGTVWQRFEVLRSLRLMGERFNLANVVSADVGPDGTVWVRACLHCTGASAILARLDGTDWTVFGASDGVPRMGGEARSLLGVAPDGSVWVSPSPQQGPHGGRDRGCGGLHNFDGTTWTRYLQGTCVYAMDIAPDGAVWLRGRSDDFGTQSQSEAGPLETYVIRPLATAITE